jgi:hypothetical protein
MARKKIVDYAQLIAAVESGTVANEVMDKFDINTRTQLKTLYLDALVEVGRAKAIVSRASKGSAQAKQSREIRVNKRGSVVVPREMVENMGFSIGDTFSIRKTKSGVSLKRA